MHSHLAQFSQHNDPPSEDVLKDIKGELLNPLKDLESRDIEIDRLTKALNDLTKEHDVLKKAMDEFAPILSPIRRLPSDIIHEIFYHCLPTHRNAVMSITEAPLLLTRICQSWRSIALSSHRIWSALHIPLSHYSMGNYPFPPSPVIGPNTPWGGEPQRVSMDKHAKMVWARCRLVDAWLSRSGHCPLSISLSFIGVVDSNPVIGEESPLLQIFNTVLSFSQRISNLELSMPAQVYEILQTKLSLEMLPQLRNLKASFPEQVYVYPGMTKRSILLFHAPNLQSISLLSDNILAFDSRTTPPSWGNLTNLAFYSAITSTEVVHVLRRCRNLRHCKFAISDSMNMLLEPEEMLSLPHLRSLSIRVAGVDMMEAFYRRIDAPILNSLEYQIYNGMRYGTSSPGNSPPPLYQSPLFILLGKSNSLRRLTLDTRILSHEDILSAFRSASQVTHLIIGERPYPGMLHRDYGYSGPGNFNLGLLIPKDDSKSNANFLDETLLPKLEVLEIYSDPINGDEFLQEFILSRLDDSPQTEVRALKIVKVKFDRAMETDIKEAVYRRAEEVGVQIELDLRYSVRAMHPDDLKYNDLFSPWYGLTDDDRSWDYVDFENQNF